MNFKRTVALLLTLVMFLGNIPALAVSAVEGDVITYNFDLLKQYPEKFSAGTYSVNEQKSAIDELYNAGEINWRYHSHGILPTTNSASGSIYKNQWSGQGIEVFTAYHDWYYAIEFRAPGTGSYNISFDTYLLASGGALKHSTWAKAFLVKVSEFRDVQSAMTDANKAKRFAPTVENTDAFIGNFALEAGEKYIIILNNTIQDSRDASSADGLSTTHLHLKGLTLEESAPPEPVNGGYSFDLLNIYPDDFNNDSYNAVEDQKDKIDALFNGGYLGWTFYGKGAVTDTKGDIYRNFFLKGTGIQIFAQNYDWWYALRIKAPGSGYHKVTMNSYLTYSGGQYKHSMWTNAYLVEASKIDNGTETIEDSMLKRNLLGTFNPTTESPNVDLGYYNFTEGKEYILILRQSKKTYTASTEDGLSTLNMYLKGLDFEYTANPPAKEEDSSTTVVFDFDLGDTSNGIYPSGTLMSDKTAAIDRLYKLDELNWNVEKIAAANAKYYIGVTTYGATDDYVAFRIKSPGEGLYTLSLNHAKSGRGGTGAVYILPVSAADDPISATDIHNRVGRVKYYNDSGDPNPSTDSYNTLLGTWEFGADEEYIVVFEAYAPCPYGVATSYMYFSQLICEAGDTSENYVAEKKASTIMIKDGPVTTLDVCIYLASGQVNGHDYLYLPIEGKKMNIYDIDNGEFVAQVETPFTTSRGIAVDDEGIVWVVGDNPYIYRYDPVLNVGTNAYYYKSYTQEGGSRGDSKIYGVQSTHDMCYGSDGALYFGSSMGANFGRYEIATGKFTNLGSFGGDGATYACTPAYYAEEDVLLGTISGDNNADGHKSTILVKMNAKTGEVISHLDISEITGQKEVMLRGAGICGGVMLIGGDSAGTKKAIAVDIATMTLIDIGIPAHIASSVTEVHNGKVYFQTQGKGIWEFDGATRTAKRMDHISEAYNLPMCCNEDSFITVEGDANFPGESILSFRYGTYQPVVLNIETGKFKVLEGIVSEDHGTGNQILSMATNPDNPDYLYLGVFNNLNCSVLDIKTGKIVQKYETNGQTDAMVFYDGKLFVGNYSSASLVQINLDDKNRNVSLITLKDTHDQARVHSMTAGGGKVFIGTIPYTYKYGGCLAWWDLEELQPYVERNVVFEQNIVGLAYHDGLIYGGTATGGGLSADPKPGQSAVAFIYDVENKKKILEVDPGDYIDGLPETIRGVTGFVADPEIDKNGLIWGITGGTVFTLKYDKTTGKVEMKEQLSFDKTEVGENWVDTPMQIIDGYLYVYMGTKGGMRKINIRNVDDNVRLPIPRQYKYYIGEDGNLYYGIDAQLYMYPLNVTDSDWAAAEVVDEKLADISKKITLNDEATLKEIRKAYEALSWTQKSLIQNYYKLEDAEIELLECKIDTLVNITIKDADFIRAVKREYDSLPSKSKNYVKNFETVLVPAIQQLQGLLDKDAAAKVQKLIDTIPGMGQINLDKEAEIRKIETAYNALTIEQKKLVEATHLEKALATINALRKERIAQLKKLMESIGSEITLEDEASINEAMDIYEWMTLIEREGVDYITLVSAEKALIKLQKDAAAQVDLLITQIGDSIDHNSKDAIEAARKAYDALTPGSKEYVKLLTVLTEAEAIYAELGLSPTSVIIIVAVAAAVVVALGCGITVLLVMKKKKAANAQETADEDADATAEANVAE